VGTLILSSAYLAPVQYYSKLLHADKVFIEQYEHYTKQTYRNRCIIAAPTGELALTVPIVKPDSPKCYMRDIRISDHGNWRHLHWNALTSAYNHSPFFEYYRDDFAPFYEQKYEFLMDFNEELCRLVCSLLEIEPHIERTASYQPVPPGEPDWREQINPKKDYRADSSFTLRPYYQVFQGRDFLPNLSIVDLLFNMGRESVLYL
jgi:hypothetical protein